MVSDETILWWSLKRGIVECIIKRSKKHMLIENCKSNTRYNYGLLVEITNQEVHRVCTLSTFQLQPGYNCCTTVAYYKSCLKYIHVELAPGSRYELYRNKHFQLLHVCGWWNSIMHM